MEEQRATEEPRQVNADARTTTQEAVLRAERLSLAYERQLVVPELDLRLPAGRITALIGPNGCGKSTLLKGLARLLAPRQGVVYLDGKLLQRLPTKEIARRMAVLPQGPVPPEGLTVRELVAQGRYPRQTFLQQWSQEDERATEAALARTGMVELADRLLDSLSGGQRQRAWIAMTLAQQASTLLLDEPTTFLDLAHQVEVMELLCDLNQDGASVVVVLHDLNQAARYAHHLVAMRDGRVLASGAPAEVLSEAVVEAVFGLACRVVPDPVSGSPMCIPVGRRRSVG